jgi:hypothetical protein
MVDSPSSFGSGKPAISRVPEGGGGAFRPRPVRGAAKARATLAASEVKSSAAMVVESVAEETPHEGASDQSALWARLAAVNARRQALKDRSARWSREGVGTDG